MRYDNEIANFNLKPAFGQENAKCYQYHIEQNTQQEESPQMTGRCEWKRGLHKVMLNFLTYSIKKNDYPCGEFDFGLLTFNYRTTDTASGNDHGPVNPRGGIQRAHVWTAQACPRFQSGDRSPRSRTLRV